MTGPEPTTPSRHRNLVAVCASSVSGVAMLARLDWTDRLRARGVRRRRGEAPRVRTIAGHGYLAARSTADSGDDDPQRLLEQMLSSLEVAGPSSLDGERHAGLDEPHDGVRDRRHSTGRSLRTGRRRFWCAGGAQRTIRKRRRPRSVGFPSGIAAF